MPRSVVRASAHLASAISYVHWLGCLRHVDSVFVVATFPSLFKDLSVRGPWLPFLEQSGLRNVQRTRILPLSRMTSDKHSPLSIVAFRLTSTNIPWSATVRRQLAC